MKNRPLVFIGSSKEGLNIARLIQAELYEDAEPVAWCQGVFGLTGGTLDSLVRESEEFDFAVFVLTPDDLLVHRGNTTNAPRDNVLFELGLFMGRLGRERTFFVYCSDHDIRLPSDLAGVTAATYRSPSNPQRLMAALCQATTPILIAIRQLGRKAAHSRPADIGRELDGLRSQVADMRLLLSSIAATASIQEMPKKGRKGSHFGIQKHLNLLAILPGVWVAKPTGSIAACKLVDGIARFLYCYRTSRHVTGEYFDWKQEGNAAITKFRWFVPGICGYSWLEIASDRLLRGGWWYYYDVPDGAETRLPHVPRMIPIEWEKTDREIPAEIVQGFAGRIWEGP